MFFKCYFNRRGVEKSKDIFLGKIIGIITRKKSHGLLLFIQQEKKELVDNIIPAVKRAMEQHPEQTKSDDIIPAAIEENVWQGVTDLFMISATTRQLVNDGKVKVVGAVYDVGTGKIKERELNNYGI